MVGAGRHRLVAGVVRDVALGGSPNLSSRGHLPPPANSLVANGLPHLGVRCNPQAAACGCDLPTRLVDSH